MIKKIGVLYDNISGNTGDEAIGLSVKKILDEYGFEYDELIPGRFNPYDYERIIIGGGHLLRNSPNFYYDKFKVKGKHILNAMGIVEYPNDLFYLNEYEYITFRSNGDKDKIKYINKESFVVPCTTMLLENLEKPPIDIKKHSIGIHIMPNYFSIDDEKKFVKWVSELPYNIYFIPITHYCNDYIYLRKLSSQINGSIVLPILNCLEIKTMIGQFDYFISFSLHGAIFSYINNVPFILWDTEKMRFFLQDRKLDKYLFNSVEDIINLTNDLINESPNYSDLISKDMKVLEDHKKRIIDLLPKVLFNVKLNNEEINKNENNNINRYINTLMLENISLYSQLYNNQNENKFKGDSLTNIINTIIPEDNIQVFWGDGYNFNEENSVNIPFSYNNNYVDYEIELPNEAYGNLRIDLGSNISYMKLKNISVRVGNVIDIYDKSNNYDGLNFANGIIFLNDIEGESIFISTNNDPQILLKKYIENKEKLKIKVNINVKRTEQTYDDYINHLKNTINILSNVIVNKNRDIESAKLEINNECEIIKEKLNNTIKALQEENQGKGEVIESLQKEKQEKDELIESLQGEIREKNKDIVLMQSDISKFETERDNNNKLIEMLKGELFNAENEIQKLNAQLIHIYNSGGWKVLLKYYKIRDRILPYESWRRRFLKIIFNLRNSFKKSKRYIKLFGYKEFFKEVKQKLFNKNNNYNDNNYINIPHIVQKSLDTNPDVKKENINISVIIPTKNAGENFEKILSIIKNQKGFNNIETIIVDSGSSDRTVEIAKLKGANVIQIPEDKFSHSYSRNLGADNSNGDVLFFTTQDALMPSDLFLYELYDVMKNNDVVAVSCAEFPYANADMFYRIICWNHYRFLEVDKKDRILSMPDIENNITLRKNGQLSDIANLIKRDIFFKYRYRFNYAEDLDLGMRLIKDKYKLAFLGSIRIIHSHNRPAYYFLKRGYVDNVFLSNIFPDFVVPDIDYNLYINDIIFSYNFFTMLSDELSKLYVPDKAEKVIDYINIKLKDNTDYLYPLKINIDNNIYIDNNLKDFIKNIYNLYLKQIPDTKYNGFLINAMSDFLRIIFSYIIETYEIMDNSILIDFITCIFKAFSLMCGAHMAYCYLKNSENSTLKFINDELIKGV